MFGDALLKYTNIAAAELGIELVGNNNHLFGERQYAQYLTKMVSAKPEAVRRRTAQHRAAQFHALLLESAHDIAKLGRV